MEPGDHGSGFRVQKAVQSPRLIVARLGSGLGRIPRCSQYQLWYQRGGGEFTIGYDIVELVEPELIVLRSDPMPQAGMHEPTVVRVEFHDHGAKTRMTLTDSGGRAHAAAGWNAAFDKLAAFVAG